MPSAYLQSQRLIRISGPEAQPFLQNLITTDIAALPVGGAWPGALLTPQGKILFDFVVWRDGEAFLLETDLSQQDGLARRLTLYRLRTPVEITPLEEAGVTVTWGPDAAGAGAVDLRFARAGISLARAPGRRETNASQGDYDALRIEAGVPVSGADFELQDAFPHDILLDLAGGVSFRKGCYVGQEVVSRMQHRGTARRRLVHISGERELPPQGTEITAAGKPIGVVGTVSGTAGLAIVRTDRVGSAIGSDMPVLAGDVPLAVRLPEWSGLVFPADEEASP